MASLSGMFLLSNVSCMLIWRGFCYAFVFVRVGGFLNTALPASFMPDARLRSHGPVQTSYSLCNCLAVKKGLLLGFCVFLGSYFST